MPKQTLPPGPKTPRGGTARYRDRIFDAKQHDPYHAAGKYAEPTHCGTCGAVFHNGRWQWGSAPEGSHVALCPACRRIREKLPAGVMTMDGFFVQAHRSELVDLVRNEAEHERGEHPMDRVMDIVEDAERVVVNTTDIHLPRRIGEALKRAYDGQLDIKFGQDEYSVRVHWHR